MSRWRPFFALAFAAVFVALSAVLHDPVFALGAVFAVLYAPFAFARAHGRPSPHDARRRRFLDGVSATYGAATSTEIERAWDSARVLIGASVWLVVAAPFAVAIVEGRIGVHALLAFVVALAASIVTAIVVSRRARRRMEAVLRDAPTRGKLPLETDRDS